MYSANCTVSPASPVTSINNLLLNLNILSWSTQTTFIVIHWPIEGMWEVKPLGTSEAKLISPCFIRKYKSIWKDNVAHWVIVWDLIKFSSIRATLRKWSEKKTYLKWTPQILSKGRPWLTRVYNGSGTWVPSLCKNPEERCVLLWFRSTGLIPEQVIVRDSQP